MSWYFCRRDLPHTELRLIDYENAGLPTVRTGADSDLAFSTQIPWQTEEAIERPSRGPNARTRSIMRSIDMRFGSSFRDRYDAQRDPGHFKSGLRSADPPGVGFE